MAWTRHWSRQQFALLELAMDNEDHVFARRRHADNLRIKKTKRRYAVAARQATVSKLGDCLIVASYKENPKVQLLQGQSAEWWAYHRAAVLYRREDGRKPARWHRKVLACTDPTATARQVVEWYEVRWQVELFFRWRPASPAPRTASTGPLPSSVIQMLRNCLQTPRNRRFPSHFTEKSATA